MGVFKSMRDLQKQAKEIEKNSPPASVRMQQGMDRMQAASQMMAAQTQAANAAINAAAGNGIRRQVTITGMRQVGQINFDLLMEFDLTVLQEGLPPYPATTQQAVSQMQIGQLRPGVNCEAVMDPANPAAIWLDLTTIR